MNGIGKLGQGHSAQCTRRETKKLYRLWQSKKCFKILNIKTGKYATIQRVGDTENAKTSQCSLN